MIEFCHDIQPFMQPHPHKNQGGDCFACSLTAVLQNLFPENPPSFDTVWNYFMQPYYRSEEKGLSNTWTGMGKAITEAYSDNYYLDSETELYLPQYNLKHYNHTFYRAYGMEGGYTRRLEGWLRSGWIAIANIHFNECKQWSDDWHFNDTDHFIVLDGIREVWEECPSLKGARKQEFYIHVVCSVKGAYWIKTFDLLNKHGLAGYWIVRKSDR